MRSVLNRTIFLNVFVIGGVGMFWFLESQMAYITTELAGIQFQTILATGFMHPQFPWTASPPHRHLTCELYFVSAGQCTARCDGRDFVCHPSDLLFISAGTRHHVSQMSEDTVLHSLQFSIFPTGKQDSPLYAQLRDKLSSPILLRGQDKLLTLLNQLRQECALQQPLYDITVDALLQQFYAQLLRSILEVPAADLPQRFPITPPDTYPHHPGDNLPPVFYMAVLDSFFNNFPLQKASLDELSLRLRVSVSQTRRLVQKHYGVSFQEKLIQAKLERSKFLMKNPALSLKAVAERAGYGSYNAFFEAFTARMGQTPSQYREVCTKELSLSTNGAKTGSKTNSKA